MASTDPDTDTTPNREPPQVFRRVRDEDHAVLTCIRDGDDTVRALNDRLTLTRRQINYSLKNKLEENGLIVLHRYDGFTTSVVNGQKQTHQKSKQASLTETGMAYFEWKQRQPDLGRFDKEWVAEQADKVSALEDELEQVKTELRKHKQAIQQLHRAGVAPAQDD